MERQYIEEHSVIERYLQGKLAPDEQAAFEEAYLADPDLLEQVELAERLKEGLEALDAAKELSQQKRGGLMRKFASPQYAAAASILLLISIAFSAGLYRENVALRSGVSFGGGTPVTRLEPLITVRGTSANTIAVPAENVQIVLLVDPGLGNYDSFRARVTRIDPPELVAERTDLEPGYEDYLAVAVPGRLLTPGEYEVVIEGRVPNGTGQDSFEETMRVPVTIEEAPAP